MIYKLGASLACAAQLNLDSEIKLLTKCGIDFLHVDIMDGVYVNNYCFGTNILEFLKQYKNIEIEVHMMVIDPLKKIDFIKDQYFHKLSFHIEACHNPIQTLTKIKSLNKQCGIAINAATNESVLSYLYDYIDYILVMAVEAGHAGQDFIESTIEKVRRIRREFQKRKMNKDIYVDGHIDSRTVSLLSKAGANAFVGGSSGLFKKDSTIFENYEKLKKAIKNTKQSL